MSTIYTSQGAIAYATVTITADADISADTVQLCLGGYYTAGDWQTPDVLTFSTDGKTATAKLLLGVGHLNPAVGRYWVWWRVVDNPTITIEPVRGASVTLA